MHMASSTITLISLASLFLVLLLNPSISAAQHDNILYSGEDLLTGELLEELGIYKLIMQEDCNLVLYDKGGAIWASNTSGLATNCHCSMQKDGNLVVYQPNGKPLWASNTGSGDGYYVLILQRDRNLVIYGGAIWATRTNAYYSLNSKGGGAGPMDVVSIADLPSPIIYMDGTELAKNVTNGVTGHKTTGVTGRITAGVTGRITTRAGKVVA